MYTAKTRYQACLSILLTLSLAYPAAASFSHARATFNNVKVSSGNITWLNADPYTPYSSSDVDTSNSPESSNTGITDTHAQISLASEWAEASTTAYKGSTDSKVIAPAIEDLFSRSEALQIWWIKANADTTVILQLDYLCALDMAADADGGKAEGQAYVSAELLSESGSSLGKQDWKLWYGIEDGDDFSKVDTGTLEITVSLLDGQRVRLDLSALSDASAYSVVPAPGAAVLGMAGLAALGCLRRRKTL